VAARRLAVTTVAAGVLAGSIATAAAGNGWTAPGFARAEVGYYASRLPITVATPAAGVDRSCFSAADNHVDPELNAGGRPTNPAWY
jgi:hypothetical protein